MERAVQVARLTTEYCIRLAWSSVINAFSAFMGLVLYVAKTAFAGIHLAVVSEKASSALIASINAALESVFHSIPLIPGAIKPLVQLVIFAGCQRAIEACEATKPGFVNILLSGNADAINRVVRKLKNESKSSSASDRPVNREDRDLVSEHIGHVSAGTISTSVVLGLQRWRHRSLAKRCNTKTHYTRTSKNGKVHCVRLRRARSSKQKSR